MRKGKASRVSRLRGNKILSIKMNGGYRGGVCDEKMSGKAKQE